MPQGVINETPEVAQKNFAPSRGTYNPGKTKGLIIYRDGDLLTTAQLSSIFTNLQAKCVDNTYSNRAWFIREFDGTGENNGEAVAYANKGQLKYKSDEGTVDMLYSFINKYADYQQMLDFVEGKDNYYAVPVDENSVMRFRQSTTGIVGHKLHALEVIPLTDPVTGAVVDYKLRVAYKSIKQYIRSEHRYISDANNAAVDVFDDLTGLRGVEQVEISDGGTTGNGKHLIEIKGSAGEENLVALYPAVDELLQTGAFKVTLSDGTEVTVTGVALSAVNGVNRYIELTLDQTDYTTGVTGIINLNTVSTLFGYIGRYIEATPYRVTLVK